MLLPHSQRNECPTRPECAPGKRLHDHLEAGVVCRPGHNPEAQVRFGCCRRRLVAEEARAHRKRAAARASVHHTAVPKDLHGFADHDAAAAGPFCQFVLLGKAGTWTGVFRAALVASISVITWPEGRPLRGVVRTAELYHDI